MGVIKRTATLFVSILLLCPVFVFDTSLAELWVCPGTDVTEAFTDQPRPGCHKRNDSRPAVPPPPNTVPGVQQRPLDVSSRFQLALIDYEQVHTVLVERCSRSYPDSVPALQTAIDDWQRTNRDALRELRELWRNSLSVFRGGAIDGEKQAVAIPNMMTANLKTQMVKLGEGDLKPA